MHMNLQALLPCHKLDLVRTKGARRDILGVNGPGRCGVTDSGRFRSGVVPDHACLDRRPLGNT